MTHGCVVFAVSLLLALPATGAEKTPKSVLPEAARAAPAGRGVSVVVAQAEIGANINPTYVTVAAGGGLVAVLIDAKIGADRAKRAEVGITPVRAALIDFDADALAIEATRSAMAAIPWLNGGVPAFARDSTPPAKSARLDAASEDQVVFFEYVYDIAPDFSAIRVNVRISLVNKQVPEKGTPESRLKYRNIAYDQTLTSVVLLPTPTTPIENSQRWAARDGALARRALPIAFSEIQALIPRAMNLTLDDLQRMKAMQPKTLGTYGGKLQEEGPTGTLLFNGGLVHVQTLAE